MDEGTVQLAAQHILQTSGWQPHPDSLQVKHIADGEHTVWFIGTDYVFRAAQNDSQAGHGLEREARLKDLLRRYFTNPDWIPQAIGEVGTSPSAGGPNHHFQLERRIHGRSLEEQAPTATTERDIVAFFQQLAAVPVHLARALGVSADGTAQLAVPDEQPDNMQQLIDEACETWDKCVASGYVQIPTARLEAAFGSRDTSAIEAPAALATQLLHADLKGEHFIVEAGTGALAGVIDWADARIGDPALDLANLAMSVGQAMAQRVGRALQLDAAVLERARVMSMGHAVLGLDERLFDRDDSPTWLRVVQFRRAFEGTAVEAAFDLLDLG